MSENINIVIYSTNLYETKIWDSDDIFGADTVHETCIIIDT